MKEYIERAQLLKNLGYDETRRADVLPGSTFDIVLKEPAADVAEVRHGRWIPSDMGGGELDEAYICSECGEPWTLIDGNPAENNMRYCPACGARMDKEAKHEAN